MQWEEMEVSRIVYFKRKITMKKAQVVYRRKHEEKSLEALMNNIEGNFLAENIEIY